jgi:hypothetical protein
MRQSAAIGIGGLALLVGCVVAAPLAYWWRVPAWSLEGFAMTLCPCATPCPCRAGGQPTHGSCEEAAFVAIARGHYGATALDGLRFVTVGDMYHGEWHVVYADSAATAPERDAMLAILENMRLPRSYFAPLFLPFARGNLRFRTVERIDYQVAEGGALRQVEIPGIIRLEARLRTDAQGNATERTPGYDLLSNWIAFADNLTYRYHDADLHLGFEYSGRQANFRTFHVDKRDYDASRLLFQNSGAGSDAAEARRQIIAELHRSGALEPRPLEF